MNKFTDEDWDDIFSNLNSFGCGDEDESCKKKCSCEGDKKECCGSSKKHEEDDKTADICKKCGGDGVKVRSACICSRCGHIIWGC